MRYEVRILRLPRMALLVLVAFGALAPVFATHGEDVLRIHWNEMKKVASGEAFRGPWRMNESEFRYVDDPSVAMDDSGNIGIVWGNQSQQDIYFQVYDPGGEKRFYEPVNISESPDIFSWLPRVVFGSNEEVYVLWQEIVFSGGSHGGEIFFARSANGGESFSEPINLSNTEAGAGKGRLSEHSWHNGSLDLVKSPEGDLFAAWTEYEGKLWFSRSEDGGRNFKAPLHVAGGDDEPTRGPSLAVDSEGGIHLAWTVGEDPGADIRYTRSGDGGGTFKEPRRVGESEGHADAPKLTADSNGTVHLVYAESPHGSRQGYRILYTRLSREAEGFEAPREISEEHSERFAGVAFPSLAADGQDNLYVTWEIFPVAGGRSQGLGFSISADGGNSFASPSLVPGSADSEHGHNGSQQGLLMRKLAVDSGGFIAIVNSTFQQNERSAIWLFTGEAAAP